jgi:hypothetical protein
MTLRRPHRSLRRYRTSRRPDIDRARRETLRHLLVESLEERRLLATGPTLVGIQPNGDEMLVAIRRSILVRSAVFVSRAADSIMNSAMATILSFNPVISAWETRRVKW